MASQSVDPASGSAFESGAFWPGSGLWAASCRVMFALAAIWAMLSVGLWAGVLAGLLAGPLVAGQGLPVGWHVSEMLFGLGGAALAGYLPTACASWTGRAPVGGWPVVVLAALWVLARAVAFFPQSLPVSMVAAAAMFWWLAGLLAFEMWKGVGGLRPGFVAFCVVAGAVAAASVPTMRSGSPWFPALVGVVLFTSLLLMVGGRMVPAFLAREARRRGRATGQDRPWLAVAAIALVVLAAGLRAGENMPLAGGLLILAGGLVALRMAFWPLAMLRHNALLAMLVFGYAWLPIGLVLWGLSLVGFPPVAEPEALHGLMMGAMGGLILAVASRVAAHRTPAGLVARRPAVAAFALVWLSVWLRLAGQTDWAAGLWIAGWAGFAVAHLPAMRGRLRRPVFSAARDP